MDEQWFREQLANEYRKIGHYDSSVTVRQGNLAPIDLAAVAAMRLAFEEGRREAITEMHNAGISLLCK